MIKHRLAPRIQAPWWDPNAQHWPDWVNWWTDPRLAYAAGLLHGTKAERKRIEDLQEAQWRETMAEFRRGLDRDQRRREFDRWWKGLGEKPT